MLHTRGYNTCFLSKLSLTQHVTLFQCYFLVKHFLVVRYCTTPRRKSGSWKCQLLQDNLPWTKAAWNWNVLTWWREPSVRDLRLQIFASLMEFGNSSFTGLCSTVWYHLMAKWAKNLAKVMRDDWNRHNHKVFIGRLTIYHGGVKGCIEFHPTAQIRANTGAAQDQKQPKTLRLSTISPRKSKKRLFQNIFKCFNSSPYIWLAHQSDKKASNIPVLCKKSLKYW